jgi:hypothetical protein
MRCQQMSADVMHDTPVALRIFGRLQIQRQLLKRYPMTIFVGTFR